jgi:adenosylcobinamide-phosphate synthase
LTRLELLAGFGLDLALGDPRWLPHPVRGIGWIITKSEQLWRSSGIPLRLAGMLLCASVVGFTTGFVWITLPWANVYWIYSLVALRSLDKESMAVVESLRAGDLNQARSGVAMVVGRDTGHLDESEIVRAVIETVSENLSDGVIAPLFYLALLGPAGMAAFKAVSTLDSMVGYRNERYSDLGWASARLDDVLNFVPARLSAALVWAAAAFVGMKVSKSISITLRDGASQSSPNSGWPEAAFAGALGVRLGGLNTYKGAACRKPHLGDEDRPLTIAVFGDTRKLLYASSLLMMGLVIAWRSYWK